MLSPYLYFPTAFVALAAVLFVAARVPHQRVPPYLKLWAAIVLLSAVEALALRTVPGPVYVAANFVLVFALLLAACSFQHSNNAPLLHLFAHVVCALYLRVASWLLFTGSAS
jgi:hypothetical protein